MIADEDTTCVFLAAPLKDRHPTLFADLHRILVSHGVEVRLLHHVKDIWARDYAPVQVGPDRFVKFHYFPDYLNEEPGLRTGKEVLKSFRGLGRCRRSNIILDGGNVVASRTKAVLTDKIYKENPGWNRSELRDELQDLLRVDQAIIIAKEPYDPIGHSDAMVRFINEDTVLVNDYSRLESNFGVRFLKKLRMCRLAIETLPYCPERRSNAGIPSAAGCYTNYLRTEKVLVAPIYGIKQDDDALKKLASVFAGRTIVPLNCTDLARDGGVLNCIAATYRFS